MFYDAEHVFADFLISHLQHNITCVVEFDIIIQAKSSESYCITSGWGCVGGDGGG